LENRLAKAAVRPPDCAHMAKTVQRLRDNEKLLALCGSTFLVMVGQGVVSPTLPLFAEDFGVSTSMVGLTLTTFAVARLIVNVPAGMIADRYGRRFLLVGGPIVTSVGMVGSGLAGDIWTLLAWRFVAGAGSAIYMSAALVYLIDIARPDQLTKFVATNQWALSLGVALGPGIGGLIASRYGLAAPFHVVGALAIVAAVYSAIRLPETRPNGDELDEEHAIGAPESAFGIRDLLFDKRFLALALTTMTIFMTRAGTRGVLIPLRADRALDWGPAQIGLMFTLTGAITLVTLMPSAWAADNIGRRQVMLFSGVMAGIGVLTVASAPTALAFVGGNLLMSLGTGTAGPAPAAFAASITPKHMRGMGIALYRSAGDVGFIAGPFLLGWLSDATSIAVALRVAAGIVAAAGVWFFVAMRNEPAAGRQVGSAG